MIVPLHSSHSYSGNWNLLKVNWSHAWFLLIPGYSPMPFMRFSAPILWLQTSFQVSQTLTGMEVLCVVSSQSVDWMGFTSLAFQTFIFFSIFPQCLIVCQTLNNYLLNKRMNTGNKSLCVAKCIGVIDKVKWALWEFLLEIRHYKNILPGVMLLCACHRTLNKMEIPYKLDKCCN